MGGLNFRLGTYNFPPGSRPQHLKTRPKAEFNTPPSYFKESGYFHQGTHKLTKFCIYSKRPPFTQKKLLPQTNPRNEQILYLLKTHLSYIKKSCIKFCIYSKRPPLTSEKVVTSRYRLGRGLSGIPLYKSG